tara:strand:- start:12480 stop:13145 length:666 start_codon:yes stop_codon:yes gene_type:complete
MTPWDIGSWNIWWIDEDGGGVDWNTKADPGPAAHRPHRTFHLTEVVAAFAMATWNLVRSIRIDTVKVWRTAAEVVSGKPAGAIVVQIGLAEAVYDAVTIGTPLQVPSVVRTRRTPIILPRTVAVAIAVFGASGCAKMRVRAFVAWSFEDIWMAETSAAPIPWLCRIAWSIYATSATFVAVWLGPGAPATGLRVVALTFVEVASPEPHDITGPLVVNAEALE